MAARKVTASVSAEGHARIQARSAQQLSDAFITYRQLALASARRMLGDPSWAEDAVQLGFLQLGVRLVHDPELFSGDPRGCVLRSTRWAALKLLERDIQRHGAAPLPDTDHTAAIGPADWHSVEARMLCAEILGAVPEHYREVLRLRYLEDQPDAVAAARLRLSLKAYRCRLDRAVLRARRCAEGLGMSAFAFILPVPGAVRLLRRRLAGWRARAAARLEKVAPRARCVAEVPQLSHLATMTVGLLVALPLLAPGAAGAIPADLHGAAGTNRPAAALLPGSGGSAAPVAAIADATGHGSSRPSAPAPSPTSSPGFLNAPIVPTPPDKVSPERTMISFVAVAPKYDENHVLVASGYSGDCSCYLIFRSDDAGATWASARAPSPGPAIVLPPDYPRDPRLLLSPLGGGPSCLAPDFGAVACVPLPLSAPVAFDAAFDKGFPVIYGNDAAEETVIAFNVETLIVHTLLPPASNVGSAGVPIATPAAVTPVALYAIGETTTHDPVGALSSLTTEFYVCRRDFTCTTEMQNQVWPISVVADNQDSNFVGATPGDSLDEELVSTDGGATFNTVHTVQGMEMWGAVQLAGSASSATLWARMRYAPGGADFSLWRRPVASGAWQQAPLPPGVSAFNMFPISSDRAIVVGLSSGFWCTGDAGRTWSSRCPTD